MKKNYITGVISGLVVGALIFGGVPTFAAVKSIIGAKVTGVYSVEQNGKKIADAAVINGSTYAPVRAIAEATGTSLTVEGKRIILDVNEGGSVPLEGDALSPEELELTNQIQKLRREVLTNHQFIESENETIKMYEDKIAEENSRTEKVPSRIEGLNANIAKSKERIAEYQTKIDFAETEIKQLEAILNK
jgi:hypothetical protein